MQTLSSLTEEPYHDLVAMAANQPEEMGDATALDGFNQILQEKNAYLLVRKSDTVIYVGTDMKEAGNMFAGAAGQLDNNGEEKAAAGSGGKHRFPDRRKTGSPA